MRHFVKAINLLLIFFVSNSIAQEKTSLMEDAERMRDGLSENWMETSRYIDSWLSGEQSSGSNKSRVNISIEQFIAKGGEWETDLNIRGKLDIPTTKRKLKLYFDSDADDQNSLENKKLNTTQNTFSTIGLGQENTLGSFTFKTELGAKFRIPIDPFARFKAEAEWQLTENWQHGLEQKIWYFHEDGWGESTEYFLFSQLNENYDFRISTEVQFRQEFDEFEYGQFFTLYNHTPNKFWQSYTFGITGSSQPNPQADTYFFAANYLRPIYKDWIFISFDPRLRFTDENSWKANPEIEMRIDILFQGK